MINKIPVGRTIARGYGFAFSNIVNNLGGIWIPAVILWTCSFFLFRPHMTQFASGDPQAVLHAMPTLFLYVLAALILISRQMAALTKEALRLRTGSAFLQFPFDAAAWRLVASYLCYILAMIAVYIAILIVAAIFGVLLGSIAGAVSGGAAKPANGIATGLTLLAVVCAVIYIAVRLSFLLAPVSIAEHRIAVIRSWELLRGNFWRAVAVLLSVIAPLLLVEFVYLYALYGTALIPPFGRPMTPEAIAHFHQHQQQLMLAALQRTQNYWFLTYPFGLLFSVVTYGLFAGVSAFAYEELAPSDSGESRGWLRQWVSRSLDVDTTPPKSPS